MGLRHRLTLVAILVAIASVTGCKRKPKEETTPPPDHLAFGELPLGPDKAFALPLPRGAQISTQSRDDFVVTTQFSPEVLANFVRYHVTGGKVVVGAGSTLFEDVTVKGDPKRMLYIEVRASGGTRAGSTMIVRDNTGGDPKLPPPEHYKQLGLTPDGKLADPKHME